MNKPTLKYAATEALAMLEEAIELFGSGEKGDQIVANLRFALAEESAEIDALKEERDHAYSLLRGRTPAQCDLLSLEIAALKAENRGLADLFKKKVDDYAELDVGTHREIEALKAENERLRKDAEALCKAGEEMQKAMNELWKAENPDELSEDDTVLDHEEALELHGEAWKALDTAVYYMRKGMSALPDTKGDCI